MIYDEKWLKGLIEDDGINFPLTEKEVTTMLEWANKKVLENPNYENRFSITFIGCGIGTAVTLKHSSGDSINATDYSIW